MENPFESGHIKNYILLYVSIVVIMILFFIASTLFHDVENKQKKVFEKEQKTSQKIVENEEKSEKNELKFKLLEKAY